MSRRQLLRSATLGLVVAALGATACAEAPTAAPATSRRAAPAAAPTGVDAAKAARGGTGNRGRSGYNVVAD